MGSLNISVWFSVKEEGGREGGRGTKLTTVGVSPMKTDRRDGFISAFMWSICSVHKPTLDMQFKTKVPTVHKARSHDPKPVMSHKGGGRVKTGHEWN